MASGNYDSYVSLIILLYDNVSKLPDNMFGIYFLTPGLALDVSIFCCVRTFGLGFTIATTEKYSPIWKKNVNSL